MRRKPAFSMVEMMTGLVVIAIIIAAMTMKSGSSRHSIRREAERVAAYINSLTQTADRNHTSFQLDFFGGSFTVRWAGELYKHLGNKSYYRFKMDSNYKLTSNVSSLNYSIKNNTFTRGGTITVTKKTQNDIKDLDKYYIIVAVIGGRIRTSPEPPANWEVSGGNYTY